MDLFNLLHYVTALILVAVLAGAAFLIKRYGSNPAAFKEGLPGKLSGKLSGKLGKWTAPQRRLVVVETLMVGPKQRLLIIRRDDVEHLVLAGADGATVIEANIPPSSAPSGAKVSAP
jgi:flagellar protein FliO/FliZ